MRRVISLTLLAIILLIIILPAAVVGIPRNCRSKLPEHGKENSSGWTSNRGTTIRLYRPDQKKVVEIDLEEYLIGVVAAEMPATFEMEALKAQAVASRTYTLRRCRLWGGCGCDRSPEPADVCSDSTHCQAWLDPNNLECLGWSDDQKEELLDRIKTAVLETAGQVAMYDGELIEAVYHSTCGGLTESSRALWGGDDIPYLQNVICPYCEHSPYYRTQILISHQVLANTLPGNLVLPVTGELPVVVTSQTTGKRVAELKIGDHNLGGSDLRKLFQLPSLACSFQADSRGVLVSCQGKGHGVGLCQYGADGAASQGKTYREIISFYYNGAEIMNID